MISLRSATTNRAVELKRAETTRIVAAGPMDLILNAALNSAKLTADVLAARDAAPKTRR